MAMAHVQDDAAQSGVTATYAFAFSFDVTAGNVVCGGIRWGTSAHTLNSIAKSAGTATIGTVTILHNPTADAAGNSAKSAMWYAVVTGSGSLTMTYTLDAAGIMRVIQAEASGVNTTSPLKGSAMQGQPNPGTGTDAVLSGTTTAGVDGDYIWGFLSLGGTETPGVTAGTGFTLGDAITNLAWSEYRTTAANQATFTWDSATADSHVGVMIFAQAAAGGGTILPMMMANH